MTEPEEMEEDLFADLYDGDDNVATIPVHAADPPESFPVESSARPSDTPGYGEEPDTASGPPPFDGEVSHQDVYTNGSGGQHQEQTASDNHMSNEPFGGSMKEDGKMFIGGLNWETTDQSLHDYFSQFGDVHECTVMRDGASGRSRGFGFLTFKDPKTVNTVMVKEHFLDGKIIDPKRAIPRDEQEKTAKIFVGGVSQEASEADFTAFFAQFGRVVDATLMMDKDTGRPRGFGFVTFDSDAAVEKCLEYQPLEIMGKMIEVKRAQPRGKMGEEDEQPRGGRARGKFGRDDRFGNENNQSNQSNQTQNQGQGMMGAGGMTPQMMAQYWQRMQQYFAMMQQQMAASAMGGMGMGQMNPQMMAQMQQMQMQQMQKQMSGGQSPAVQSPGGGMNMQGTNPQMQQQMMQQMMQMQQGGMNNMNMGARQPPMGPSAAARSGFSPAEQQAFEQQKYEQPGRSGSQPARGNFNAAQATAGGPQSWEGMYDDVPQPNDGSTGGRGSAGVVRNSTPLNGKPPKGPMAAAQPSAAPANAPTGPKNAGKPGSNYRGGRGGGGRFHPYGR